MNAEDASKSAEMIACEVIPQMGWQSEIKIACVSRKDLGLVLHAFTSNVPGNSYVGKSVKVNGEATSPPFLMSTDDSEAGKLMR